MKTMKVLMLEPDQTAREAEIGSDLASMQKTVGGLIQAVYCFDEPVCMICNEEGKLLGLPLNRALYGDDGEMMDIIAGTAFLCSCAGDGFGSLSEEQMDRYAQRFRYPQLFFRTDDSIVGVPYDPEKE